MELVQEVFMHISNFEETWSFLNLHSVHELLNVNSRVHEWFDFDGDNYNDSELLELLAIEDSDIDHVLLEQWLY